MVTLHFAKLRPSARIPAKRAEDAGYDVYACLTEPFLRIEAMATALVPTGIASAFDPAWHMHLKERGSTGSKGLAVRAGIIDSGYRGEWLVAISNLNPVPLYFAQPEAVPALEQDPAPKRIHPIDKAICQALLLPVPQVLIQELPYEALVAMESQRGTGLLGSSGK